MKDTHIYFLRHGVTDWNQQGKWQGQTDIPLNSEGSAQAERVAERLASMDFDAIYASDLKRAFETAQSVGKKQKVSIQKTEAWRERHAGDFEGKDSDYISKNYPKEYHRMIEGFLEPPNGETSVEFTSRIETELDQLTARHEGESVLVVSHGGTIRGIVGVALAVPQEMTWSYQVGNTSLSLLVHTDRGWKLEFWNDTNHLEERSKGAAYTL